MMDLTTRKIFVLLLGACGLILILLANFINFETTHHVFLVAANFHNSSLSYLTALNLSLNIHSSEKHGLKSSLIKEEKLDFRERNPKTTDKIVTDVTLPYANWHNKSVVHNEASADVNREIHHDNYKSDSEIVNPQSQNKAIPFGSDSDSGRPRDSSVPSVRRKSRLSDSMVSDKYGNRRLVLGHSALNRNYTNSDIHNVEESSVDVFDNGRTREAPDVNTPPVARDYVKSGNRNHVNPEQIYEEVKLQGNDYTNNGVHSQNEDIVSEMKQENTDDINDFKKTFALRELQKIVPPRENPYERDSENSMRTSEIRNREHIDAIPSQTRHHSVESQSYFQAQTNSDVNDQENVINKEGFSPDPNCRSRATGVEDILCMERPKFLPDFRNPCWYQDSSLRCLPYFHIIGVCKTGTTDLFERLSHHPQIIKNNGILGKETWYWTWKRYSHSHFHRQYSQQMTLVDFIGMFDARSIESYTKRQFNGSLYHPAVTGHGDPMDFWDQCSWKLIPQNNPASDVPEVTTPSLIKHVNPNIKLILLLRDPVERLFSNYLHGQFGTSAIQFHADVLASVSLLTSCTRDRSMKSCLFDEDIIKNLQVPISGSFYSIHLQEWLKVFPRKQIYITRTEDFSKSIADTLLGIFRFLKLDPLPTRDLYRIANMPHYYNTKAKQTAGEILDETRSILRSLFQPYNNQLASMLNDQRYNFNTI